MDHNSTDQNWRKLQDRIDQKFGRCIGDGLVSCDTHGREPVGIHITLIPEFYRV